MKKSKGGNGAAYLRSRGLRPLSLAVTDNQHYLIGIAAKTMKQSIVKFAAQALEDAARTCLQEKGISLDDLLKAPFREGDPLPRKKPEKQPGLLSEADLDDEIDTSDPEMVRLEREDPELARIEQLERRKERDWIDIDTKWAAEQRAKKEAEERARKEAEDREFQEQEERERQLATGIGPECDPPGPEEAPALGPSSAPIGLDPPTLPH